MKSNLFAAIAAGALLAGCATVNPITLARLATVSPLRADPADFTVFLRLPAGLDVAPGQARLVLLAERRDTGDTLEGRYVLERQDLPDGQQAWRVARPDLARLRADQARARAWKEAVPDESGGSLSLTVGGCRTDAGPIAPDATVDVGLTLERDGPRLPLISGAPVTRILDGAEMGELQPCPPQ